MTDDRRFGAGSGTGRDGKKDASDPAADGHGDRYRHDSGNTSRRHMHLSRLWRRAALRLRAAERILSFPGIDVLPHFQGAFERAQWRVLRLVLPLHLLAQAISAPIVAMGVWSSSRPLAMLLLLGIEGSLLVWVCVVRPQPRAWGLLLRAVHRGRSVQTVEAGQERLDYRFFCRALQVLNAVLGLVWFVFIVLVFHRPGEDIHLLTLGVCFGLLAPLLLCSPVAGAVENLTVPVVAGAYGALLTECSRHSLLFTLSFSFEVTLCGIVVVGSRRLIAILLGRMQLASLQQQEQAEIMALLTRRSDRQGGDWLWETDREGVLRNPSVGFCQMMGRQGVDVAGQTLESLLCLPTVPRVPSAGITGAMSPERHLRHCLSNRLAFRELAVPVFLGEQQKWWLLTGQPVFRNGCFHGYRGVCADVTVRQGVKDRHFRRVRQDALTGLPNRLALQEYLQKELLEATRQAHGFVVMLASLDMMCPKEKDDLTPSDRECVLRESARRLAALGEAEGHSGASGADCFLARYGASELAVVLPEPEGGRKSALDAMMQDVLALLEQPVEVSSGHEMEVEVTMGVALSSNAGGEGESLIDAVEMALHDARRERVRRCSIFDPCEELEEIRQKNLFRDVSQALRMKAFALVYQPIVNARTGRVTGFETLCRWKGSVHGHLSIEKVIDMIGESGNSLEFDFWVLETGCRAARHWPEDLWLSVNMTAGHFSLPDMAERVLAVLEKTGMPPSRLQVEVTETQVLEVGPHAHRAFRELERKGVRIVLDDFGKGFSALLYLRQFPFSKIKLDAAFIQDMLQDLRSAAVVRNMIELAVDLGIAVTAEGVSSPEHYRHLQDCGCTEAQGFFLGRPVPEGEVALCYRRIAPDLR